MQGKWLASLQIAAVYVGTVVGAGFATGKEIVEFFTKYGSYGFYGIMISGILFIWLGVKMMLISQKIGCTSFQEFNQYLFGKKIGWFVNVLMFLILLGVTSVMLSGAGAIFEEQLMLPFYLGVLLTIILNFMVMVAGVKGLVGVNIIVVPLMILFSLCLAGKVMINSNLTDIFSLNQAPLEWNWMLSAFSYGAFNIAMSQAVLVPLANEVEDESIIKWGGIIGGAILFLILLSGNIALSAIPNVQDYQIPTAEVIKGVMYSIYGLYILVIYGEIFTSVIGNMFGLQRQLRTILPISDFVLIFLIITAAFFISLVGYGSLITFLYPLFGYVSLFLLLLLMIRKIPN